MTKSAHQAALDQAHLLASYLGATAPAALDLMFIRRHLDALEEFAHAAKAESPLPTFHTFDHRPEVEPGFAGN
jgi:hypothetical protein